MVSRRVLVLPGLGGSEPAHWQSLWEERYGFTRVEQEDWNHPNRSAWAKRLEAALEAEPEPVVLVAHSLGCALVASAAKRAHGRIFAALMVAPADVEDEERTPELTRSFAPLPLKPLGFKATVVASRDDPYVAFERAAHFADRWDAAFVDAGAAGHLNAESNLGEWPEGYRLLQGLSR
jgi:predicted alpha/beta hydrolase family esterase